MSGASEVNVGELGQPKLSRDSRTMIISIPIQLKRHGGQKRVVTPIGASAWAPAGRVDSTIVKALVRAHRWRNMLESKLFNSVRELAKAEKINESYLCRMLRLTLLSPTLTDAILDGRQPANLRLNQLLKGLPSLWETQSAALID